MALEGERRRASFDVEALTVLLDGGDAARTSHRRYLRSLIESDPVFSNEGSIYMHRTDLYLRALAKARRVHELIQEHKLVGEEAIVLRACVADDLPTALHDLMFIPSIQSLCDDEQQAYWLPLANAKKVIGCYAQTELGHGSNIRALQTAATYIAETDEFQLNTPTIESFKWWPGTLGRTANTAMVIARLIIPGKGQGGAPKDYGIHNFIVPLRDLDSHKLLPGVVTRDIGPKISFNTMDNGCLELHRVRIPRTYMASRFVRLNEGGEYVKVPGAHPKAAYITMMQVRSYIVAHSARELSKACTIAVRYSCVRRQGFDESGKVENIVMDYQTQQHRLLPLVAATFAFHFIGQELLRLTAETERALAGGDQSAGDGMAKLHAATAGLKSVCTQIAAQGIEDCRECLGGHGYLLASGIPELYCNFLQQLTVEGENYLLTQQTSNHLLKAYMRLMTGGLDANDDCAYLTQAQKWVSEGFVGFGRGGVRCPHALSRLFAMRAFVLLERMAQKLQRLMDEEGLTRMTAWGRVLIDAVGVSRAHSLYTLVRQFASTVAQYKERGGDSSILAVLNRLRALFSLHQLLQGSQDWLEAGLLSPEDIQQVRAEYEVLLREIRPDAVAIVEAWDWSDFALRSAVGRRDGDVYTALLDSAKKEPLNQHEPVQGYFEHFRQRLASSSRSGRSRL